MKVKVRYENKTHEVEGKTVSDVLGKLDINKQTVVVWANKEIVPESQELKRGDELTILRVISGG